ncbi:amino acid transporter [Drepanopeziza brunnea f. sp. 'multigermtubi' MB_m1]|uniref:Amino acid transporter n=1 Tax=Marssonina brunnea f. sp. multigermtubi (strain MB_m1) TaxID=1072389 RepID=K1W9L3_MARBU|nr:amino acid transporter [Drepanopeziza brunnea f. sp. 'multigermtubi' MB_m1]EKD13945.1 amino acid transporter [Drepanopeziza brunnea f. sp. 'multigermtubi' MB_m1]
MFDLGSLGALDAYTAIVQGEFRNSYPGSHSIADMAVVLGEDMLKEICATSLGSAGPAMKKKIPCGIGTIGLIISATTYLHVAAKYLSVRYPAQLPASPHQQHGALTGRPGFALSLLSFILAEAIPIIQLPSHVDSIGVLCFAPLAIMLPGALRLYDRGSYRHDGTIEQKAMWYTRIMRACWHACDCEVYHRRVWKRSCW